MPLPLLLLLDDLVLQQLVDRANVFMFDEERHDFKAISEFLRGRGECAADAVK